MGTERSPHCLKASDKDLRNERLARSRPHVAPQHQASRTDQVTKRGGFTMEMVAGTLGVFALTECDSFGWRHAIIGLVLALYVFQGITRRKTMYDSVVYCAVTSLLLLLIIGGPLDWLRDNHFRDDVSREGAIAITWVTLLILLFIVHRRLSRGNEVTHEIH